MTPHDIADLGSSVALLRDQAFELIERMQRSGWADGRLPAAAAQLQSVANRLGTVETMLALGQPRAA